MTIKTRLLVVSLTLLFGIALFATGIWAGLQRGDGDRRAAPTRSSFWSYDSRTGQPTGPSGQPDFWNYDPRTGAKISDYSPGVAPDDLAALWSVEP